MCVALRVFIHCPRSGEKFQTFWPRGAATGVGLVGILITGNSDGVQTSSKSVCARGLLSRPWGIFFVKFGTSSDDCSFQTRASHMKDHGFQKETCQFKLQWLMTSSFGLIKKFMVCDHHYTTGSIFWRILGIICYT